MAGTRQQKLKGGVGLHLPAGFATGHLVRLPRPPLQVVYIPGSRVTQLLAVCNDGGYTLNQGGISARIVLFRFVFLFFSRFFFFVLWRSTAHSQPGRNVGENVLFRFVLFFWFVEIDGTRTYAAGYIVNGSLPHRLVSPNNAGPSADAPAWFG